MLLDRSFANRLDRTCNKESLQEPLRRFLDIWTNRRYTAQACHAALKRLCACIDQAGKWHESESVMMDGMLIMRDEEARRLRTERTGRTLLYGVGGLVAVGVLSCVFGRRAA